MSAEPEQSPRYDLESHRFIEDPERTFSEMREKDPVYFDESLRAWVLTRYQHVSQVLRDPRFSVDRNGEIGRNGSSSLAQQLETVNAFVREFMVFSDPPRHTRLRGAVSKAFQPRALRSLEAVVKDTAHRLLDRALARAQFDVLKDYGEPLAEEITALMLGLPPEDSSQLKKWTLDLFGLVGAAQVEDDVVRSNARGMEAFHEYIGRIVHARRDQPRSDLTSKLIEEGGGEFSEREIVSIIITLIAGAFETTSHLISNGVYSLLEHPDQLKLLRRHPEKAPGAVEELLRYNGPALAVQRRALEPVTLEGSQIGERDRVYCMLHAANHDPRMFEEPELLNIDRSHCRHLGLGLGTHFCLGAWLTRMETQVALNSLLARVPHLRLADEPKWVGNFAIRGLERLPVRSGSTLSSHPSPSRTRVKVRKGQ